VLLQKIDRQLAPLSTPLVNGQTIEIITARNARPNPAWLDFVITGKAKSSLRQYLKKQRRKQSVALGKRLLNKALHHFSLSLRKLPESVLDELVTGAKLKSLDDLYEDVGLGIRVPMMVAHQVAGVVGDDNEARLKQENKAPLLIKGTEGLVVHFATCCYPLPGDPIVGVIQPGKGVLVHTEHCSQIAKRLESDECMLVRWADVTEGEFPVILMTDVLNKRGVLGEMALAISDAGANIDDIKVFERDLQHYQVSFELLVRDRLQLAEVIRNLRRVKAVVHIKRGK